MELLITGEIWWWRGPSPYHFVTVPDGESAAIREVAAAVTYGWGMIPVTARIGETTFRTSLWPKDGRYVIPLRDAVRHAEGLELGDVVTVELELRPR